ncbi:MAG: histidine ammonia-lyase [FCB group bacterium]|nr:histidine ammonia-lyase [FCB group bacterium]
MSILTLSDRTYSVHDFRPFFSGPVQVRIQSEVRAKITDCHKRFQSILSQDIKIYGVNTGFGNLSQIRISPEEQVKLQLNLVRSHAAGVGDPFSLPLTRIVLFLKLLTFSKGVSGIRFQVVEHIARFLKYDILPVIPMKGSVGASGDLAPMAHLALALIGEGDVHFQDRIIPGMVAMREVGMEPLVLQSKEGLSLINGTQVSTALAIQAILEAENLINHADLIGALSVDASLSTRNVFDPKVHQLKKHPGQRQVARNIWNLLEGSEIVASHEDCNRVQDPYSLRCMPHVHGASREMFVNAKRIVEDELNSVSDNPLILPDNRVATSGHFHGEFIAQAMDLLSIAISEIGGIAERRIHYFMKGIGDKIPPFIANNPGLESGAMIAHVTAAALVSENKTLCHPASVDSIPTSGGQEDYVSMAPWAARKTLEITANVSRILAIELLVNTRSIILFHSGLKPGKGVRPILAYLKRFLRYTVGDYPVAYDIRILNDLISQGSLIAMIQKYVTLE